MGREVVVAVTNGRLDFGTWERIFSGQAEGLARESRRAPPEAGVGQDYRGVGLLRALMSLMDCGSSGPQPRDGLYNKTAGAESQTLSPGLDSSLELGGSVELGSQSIWVDETRSACKIGKSGDCIVFCYRRKTA
jgi:hypothetical protein